MEQDTSLNKQVLNLIVPEEILTSFELSEVIESVDSIVLVLKEHKHLVPMVLKGSNAVLDGYCNPVELQSFPLKGKAVYIKLYRRRWKQAGQHTHHSNEYDFAVAGTKATQLFGTFLKGTFGFTPDTFQSAVDRIVRSRK